MENMDKQNERREVKVPLTLHELGELLGLQPGQLVQQVYVRHDPEIVWVLVEGGPELPPPFQSWPGGPPSTRHNGGEPPVLALRDLAGRSAAAEPQALRLVEPAKGDGRGSDSGD